MKKISFVVQISEGFASEVKQCSIEEVYQLLTEYHQQLINEGKPAKVEPAPIEPVPPAAPLKPVDQSTFVGEQVGTRAGGKIHKAKETGTKSHYYEITSGGTIFPRGTEMQFDLLPGKVRFENINPNPEAGGWPGVPKVFRLPEGWSWEQTSDKAYFIVPRETGNKGPAWLQNEPVAVVDKPATVAKKPGLWAYADEQNKAS